jgi:hypothetical protein
MPPPPPIRFQDMVLNYEQTTLSYHYAMSKTLIYANFTYYKEGRYYWWTQFRTVQKFALHVFHPSVFLNPLWIKIFYAVWLGSLLSVLIKCDPFSANLKYSQCVSIAPATVNCQLWILVSPSLWVTKSTGRSHTLTSTWMSPRTITRLRKSVSSRRY